MNTTASKRKKYRVSGNRDLWSSKWGFILSCIGSAVGMGNIWLFPSRVAAYGGAFLAAYLFFDVVIKEAIEQALLTLQEHWKA